MRVLRSFSLVAASALALSSSVAAQVTKDATDFAVFCEFASVGKPGGGGRYWTTTETYKTVIRFASDDIIKSKILSLTDRQNLIGTITSRFRTVSNTGIESVTFVSDKPSQRQLHITLGTIVGNATITDDEGDAFKLIATGTCLSLTDITRQIAELESESQE